MEFELSKLSASRMIARMYLGVEIGGTKLQVGVCDQRGDLKYLVRTPVVRKRGRRGILNQLEQIVPLILNVSRVRRIGVGFGGPVDVERGRVIRSFHIKGWDGFRLKQWFERRFKLPTTVENDTNVAGLAEALVGAGRGKRAVFYSNVGTGIGGALVVDGIVYSGRNGSMEIGHTRYFARGQWRILEELSSGLSIERGRTTLAQSAKYYGIALANAITLLNPDVVIIGGGVSQAGEKFLRPMRQTVKRFVFSPFQHNFQIVLPKLGSSVVVVGAALLAAQADKKMVVRK